MTGALGKSINTYFALLEQQAGLCETVQMARKLGYERGDGKPIEENASITLGGEVSTPLSMASAYAAFANRGLYCTPVAIESIKAANGDKLNVPQTKCTRAMSDRTADTINQMLKGVVEDGTGTKAGLSDRDNAGKTGTTNERKDAWFVGYTPNLSTAVWVGDDIGEKDTSMFRITIGGEYYPKVCGGCLPGPIWKIAMTGALDAGQTPSFTPVSVPRADKPEDKEKEGEQGPNKPGKPNKPRDGKPGDRRPNIPGITLPPGIFD